MPVSTQMGYGFPHGMGRGNWAGHGSYTYGSDYYTIPVDYTTPTYQNQATIDSLNAILKNCDQLKEQDPNHFACDPAFITKVQAQLLLEMSKATPLTTTTYYTRPVTYITY